MAIGPVAALGIPSIAGAGAKPPAAPQAFSALLKGATPAHAQTVQAVSQVAAPGRAQAVAGTTTAAAPSPPRVTAAAQKVSDVLDRVSSAQKRMDDVLALAQSGKSFSPAELLALQSQVYRASQELDLAGKVVEKATGGVKQVLQTQV
jgi:hypothetical protein